MSQIQQGRYDALLRRVGDLKGPGSKVNDVLEELFPIFDVENLPPELYILALTDLCFGGGEIVSAAGTSGRAQLFNPAGSGKVVTITSCAFSTDGTSTMRWGRRDVLLTSRLTTELFRDTRKAGTGVLNLPTAQIRVEASIAFANATGKIDALATTAVILNDDNGVAVLGPGTGFEIGTERRDSTSQFYFYWKERVAEPSETNF